MEKYDLNDACDYITLRSDGAIEYESIFSRHFKGNFKLLLSCIEDNITDDETIDWPAVERDYRKEV